jgi:ACS family glucarate transporter-like MFS transporter
MTNPVPPAQRPGSPALGVPSRTRYFVVVFAVVLAIVQYIDRVAISQAAPLISKDLGLDKEQMALVFSAFTLAYALFEIPTGYMGDRLGARRVLIRVVLWWSFFTAATGWAWNLASLVTIRFLFGVGEAGCFPNIARAFNRWLPIDERVRAQGILWMFARWGGAAAPLLLVLVLQYVNWRHAFELFALLGIAWCFFWFRWFRDRPADHPKVNAAELALMPTVEGKSEHPKMPWAVMFSSPSLWLLWLQYFTLSYAWYFFITWFPTYLLEVHKYDLKVKGAILAGLPLFFGGFGSLFAGFLTPAITRMTGSVRMTRSILGFSGQALAGCCLIAATFLHEPILAVLSIALASFFNDVTMPGSWTTCMDIGGKFTGTVSGAMNMMGNLGGVVSPLVLGSIVKHTGNWDLTFYLTGGLYFVGAACWLFINSTKPLPQDDAH